MHAKLQGVRGASGPRGEKGVKGGIGAKVRAFTAVIYILIRLYSLCSWQFLCISEMNHIM